MKTLRCHKARFILALTFFLASILACGGADTIVPTLAPVEPTAVPPPSDIVHEFHASPAGHGNACTLEDPCSLEAARNKVRSVNKDMTGDIVVCLRGGTYSLTETLVFGPEDGGSNGHYVIYRAYQDEEPHFSGGQQIAGWTDLGNGIYQAPVAIAPFRQLYVNGRRAIRARTPNMTEPDTFGPYYRLIRWDEKESGIWIKSDQIADWRGLNDVEVVIKKHFMQSRLRLASFTASGDEALIKFQEPESSLEWNWNWLAMPGQTYYFENSPDFLDAEGEWFLDDTGGMLYYIPRAGEDVSTAEVIAPALELLVDIVGGHHIRFEDIVFEHSHWDIPDDARTSIQAGYHVHDRFMPSAVHLANTHHIRFDGNTFQHMGGGAIELAYGTHNTVIHDNTITDISGNGITVYTDHKNTNPSEDHMSLNDVISQNRINHVGQEYTGSVGIVATYPRGILIEHNEIWNMPNTGINLGWGWTPEATALRDNIVRYNDIHHVMQLHADGAGIYTLSDQPGTHILENHIHDIERSEWAEQDEGFPVVGIYLDEYSNMTVERNTIENVSQKLIYHDVVGTDRIVDLDPGKAIHYQTKERPFWQSLQKDVTKINIGGWLDSPHISPDGTELYFSYSPLDIYHFLVSDNIRRGGPDRPRHTTSGDTPEALVNTDLYVAKKDENGVWKAEAIATVNSAEYLEGCPVLSWDGQKLYFIREAIGGDEPVKVYVSERSGSSWSAPTVTGIPVGSAGDTHVSTDETEVVYDHNPETPGLPMGAELWLATRLNDGTWERHKLPETINAPGFYQHHPWLSKDGTRLYFVRYPPDEEHFEIIVAYRGPGGTFSRTETLQITGEQAGFYQEPSFPENEQTLYSAVFVSPGQGIQVWTGEKYVDGVFHMRPID